MVPQIPRDLPWVFPADNDAVLALELGLGDIVSLNRPNVYVFQATPVLGTVTLTLTLGSGAEQELFNFTVPYAGEPPPASADEVVAQFERQLGSSGAAAGAFATGDELLLFGPLDKAFDAKSSNLTSMQLVDSLDRIVGREPGTLRVLKRRRIVTRDQDRNVLTVDSMLGRRRIAGVVGVNNHPLLVGTDPLVNFSSNEVRTLLRRAEDTP